MTFELLAEEIRIERHLVGVDLHDAEPFEEPAALVAVFLARIRRRAWSCRARRASSCSHAKGRG